MSGIQDIPLHERLEAPRVWVSNGSGLGVRLIDPDWIEKRLAKIREDRKDASKKAHLEALRKTARECAEVASQIEVDEQKIEELQARLNASHKLLRVRLIIEIIATKRGIPYDVILGPGRTKAVVQARHEAMYEVKRQCPHLSLPEIGKRFGGRDHTSILHAVRKWPKKAKALGIPCEPLESAA